MNKYKLLMSLAIGMTFLPSFATFKITSPKETKVAISSMPIEDYAAGGRNTANVVTDSVAIAPGATVDFSNPKYNAVNILTVSGNDKGQVRFYSRPDDTLQLTNQETNPLDIEISGSTFQNEWNALEASLAPVVGKFEQLQSTGQLTDEAMEPIVKEYDQVLMDFIKGSPSSDAAVIAITELNLPENMVTAFGMLAPAAKNSFLYPLANASKSRAKKRIEAEARQAALESGHADAPNFILPGLDGKKVSLSDYRGKWVVLDFWGSWCRWCIKGFPDLKEAYKKYEGKLEVIGIDCGDTPEQWKSAVERFSLPWVNVYNADAPDSIDKAYGIQGFPTKIIVNPEGKIADITTGEDPEFYTRLEELIK